MKKKRKGRLIIHRRVPKYLSGGYQYKPAGPRSGENLQKGMESLFGDVIPGAISAVNPIVGAGVKAAADYAMEGEVNWADALKTGIGGYLTKGMSNMGANSGDAPIVGDVGTKNIAAVETMGLDEGLEDAVNDAYFDGYDIEEEMQRSALSVQEARRGIKQREHGGPHYAKQDNTRVPGITPYAGEGDDIYEGDRKGQWIEEAMLGSIFAPLLGPTAAGAQRLVSKASDAYKAYKRPTRSQSGTNVHSYTKGNKKGDKFWDSDHGPMVWDGKKWVDDVTGPGPESSRILQQEEKQAVNNFWRYMKNNDEMRDMYPDDWNALNGKYSDGWINWWKNTGEQGSQYLKKYGGSIFPKFEFGMEGVSNPENVVEVEGGGNEYKGGEIISWQGAPPKVIGGKGSIEQTAPGSGLVKGPKHGKGNSAGVKIEMGEGEESYVYSNSRDMLVSKDLVASLNYSKMKDI
tara:strand:- start:1287 stop:2666 length:1380 start_codon:yes stop_codon:yes gene_type:complete